MQLHTWLPPIHNHMSAPEFCPLVLSHRDPPPQPHPHPKKEKSQKQNYSQEQKVLTAK